YERNTLKCLQKQPERRYQSARELLIDLTNLQRELEGPDHRSLATAVYNPPRAPAAVPDPKELAHNDLVITHANIDDQPLMPGRPGWISQLHQNLQVRVAQLSGKQVAVAKHSDTIASADLETEVLKEIPKAKTVVSVLSPPFAHSNGCHRVVESF